MNKSTSILSIIAIVFAFISGIIPFTGILVGILLLVLRNSIKKMLVQSENTIQDLTSQLETNKLTKDELQYIDLKKELDKLQADINSKNNIITTLNGEISNRNKILEDLNNRIDENSELISKIDLLNQLDQEVTAKKEELKALDSIGDYQEFGLYTPKYNLMDSELYKTRLTQIRAKQKMMVKDKTAVDFSNDWTLDGDRKKGQAMNNDNIKLILRSFNNECDANITKVKFNNIENIRMRILKAYEVLNKLGTRMKVSIKYDYLNLKLEELDLAYEYELKKQEEKEEQQRIKEQMREEAKALKEIENAKKKLEKEETHFKNAIKDIEEKLLNCNENEKDKLEKKLKELNGELNKIENDKLDIENREQNTRAGYVYVISNIGSFGENVYKIGMTRRLEPNDRVKELGDASVPFKFDVHAMIFSNDAPALENALHKKFANKSVNKINMRKEFFKVSLDEIEEEVKKNHNEVVTFIKTAAAEEYRQSLAIEKKMTSDEQAAS